jgi:hypothetical protein
MGENATAPAITRPSILQEDDGVELGVSQSHRAGMQNDDAIVVAATKSL